MQYDGLMHHGAVTFWGGELKWKFASLRLKKQLKKSGNFQEVKTYSSSELKKICDEKTRLFIQNNPKGFGYWIWKPILILDFLKCNPEISTILYLDAGCEFICTQRSGTTWRKYLERLEKFDAIFFQNDLKECCWTKQETFTFLEVSIQEQMTDQLVGGAFLMTRKFALDFCSRWLKTMQADNFFYITDEVDTTKQRIEFRENRYDQSILSILAKRESNICILRGAEEIYFPNKWITALHKPIWTSRNGSYFSILNNSFWSKLAKKTEKSINFLFKKMVFYFKRLKVQ